MQWTRHCRGQSLPHRPGSARRDRRQAATAQLAKAIELRLFVRPTASEGEIGGGFRRGRDRERAVATLAIVALRGQSEGRSRDGETQSGRPPNNGRGVRESHRAVDAVRSRDGVSCGSG